MKKILFIALVASLGVSGCLVGPKYVAPDMPGTGQYMNANTYIDTSSEVVNLKWFNLFNDTVLTSLIDTALYNNYDLRIAISRIEQSNALYGFIKADQYPAFGYSVGAGRTNTTNVPSPTDGYNEFNLTGTVSWEIDLWGKIRHSKRGAYNDYLASIEARKAIQTQLVSDVASLYFQLRDVDNKINITRRTIQSRQQSYDILSEQVAKGYIAQLDVFQVEQLLREAEAALPNFERQRTYIEQAIDVLLGQRSAPIRRGIENSMQPLPPAIPAGLPSSLLQNRPDVKAAEYTYIAENERIGVAVAQRYPSFSITGLLGLASPDVGKLLTGDAVSSQLFGGLMGPIFQFGKNKRRVEYQKKEAEIAMYKYQKAYISALSEVESALVACATYKTENDARILQAQAASGGLTLSQARYDNGYVSYLEVLDSQRSLFNSELAVSTVKQQQLNAYVQLYKALGGGW
mgnify:FL=1